MVLDFANYGSGQAREHREVVAKYLLTGISFRFSRRPPQINCRSRLNNAIPWTAFARLVDFDDESDGDWANLGQDVWVVVVNFSCQQRLAQ